MIGDGPLSGQFTFSDNSTGSISAGFVSALNMYGSSSVVFSGGEIRSYFYAWDDSTLDISGGTIKTINPRGASHANVTGSTSDHISIEDTSTTSISGWAQTDRIDTVDSSILNLSGGTAGKVYIRDTSTMNLSGGAISGGFYAWDMSVTNITGQNFQYGDGLALNGDRLTGTGVLSGEWMDGTLWTIDILENHSTATIQIVPEPATLALLGLGGLYLRTKKKRTSSHQY